MAKNTSRLLGRAVALALSTSLLAACANPERPAELLRLQADVERLHDDPIVARYAPAELREADHAVVFLSSEYDDMRPALLYENLRRAERLVEIARRNAYAHAAQAQLVAEARAAEAAQNRMAAEQNRMAAEQNRMAAEQARAEAERARDNAEAARWAANRALSEAESERLAAQQARASVEAAREAAERARRDAQNAQSAAERERLAALAAREEAELARREAALAQQQLDHMQTMITELKSEQTERGLVVTVDDVLFEVDRAELKPGARRQLAQLADVLTRYPDTDVSIEGHTDSTGSSEYNQELSERRAAAVRSFLASQGVSQQRLDTLGLGEHQPVASNATAQGRQQNRRVEVVIQDENARVVRTEEDW